ncbi:hypothetical protein PC9H_002037 [Pleurotus ostreatus]|uniref:Uncharacterized protein n=1 Tax=Pleurotus ostreatus TaxID=5322 RepID=A0A8H6ZKV5_PLEOS|nr:uncharacterized protein PC9H_002037 [Pleurotus ostreatus]KAF7419447.1 hypothetical protein PC9H_002037 [Pleurotus ostreatus]KAJ8689752.1 hypothetical protein PTI98_012621 [Pleurotus ostreatus]
MMFPTLIALSLVAIVASAADNSTTNSTVSSFIGNATSTFAPFPTPSIGSPTFNESVIVPIGNGIYSCFVYETAFPPAATVAVPFPIATASSIDTNATDSFNGAVNSSMVSVTSFVLPSGTAVPDNSTGLPTYLCVPIAGNEADIFPNGTANSSVIATPTFVYNGTFPSASAA